MSLTRNKLRYDIRLKVDVYLINSSTLIDDIAYINEHCIKNISFISENKTDIKNLDFLSEIKHEIDTFHCITRSSGSFDFSGLKYCKSIYDLYLGNNSKGKIDLFELCNIKSLYCENASQIISFPRSSIIEKLTLSKLTDKQLCKNFFGVHNRLKTLSLSSTNLREGFDFLGSPPLETFWLYSCKEVDFKGISRFDLKEIRVERCKNVNNEGELYNVASLEWLTISDSYTLKSVNELDKLVKLKILIVLGKSFFEDGKISPIKGRLEVFNFDNKKHYDMKWKK